MTLEQWLWSIYITSFIGAWLFSRAMIKRDEVEPTFGTVFIVLCPVLNTIWFVFGSIYYLCITFGMDRMVNLFFLTKDDD